MYYARSHYTEIYWKHEISVDIVVVFLSLSDPYFIHVNACICNYIFKGLSSPKSCLLIL